MLYGVLFISWEFADIPTSGTYDFLKLAAQWGLVTALSAPIFYLLALNRRVFYISFTLITLLSSLLAYFRMAMHTTLTPMVLDLVLVNSNDAALAVDLITGRLLLFLSVGLIFSTLAIIWRSRLSAKGFYWDALVALGLLLFTHLFGGKVAAATARRMPASFYYVTAEYMAQQNKAGKREAFTAPVHCSIDSIDIVLVIGEALRADHLPMNGYHRNTMPHLSQEPHLVALPHLYSPEIYTHTSIPVLLTRGESFDDPRVSRECSFISLFKKAGFRSAWLANQESVSTFSYFMSEADTLIYVNEGKSVYTFSAWFDDALLSPYDKVLQGGSARNLVVLHTIGSHWFYNAHFDEAFYRPILESKFFSEKEKEKLINSYDNTILQTDKFLVSLIERLRSRCALLVYISDHGESLGENGKFLHADDNPPLHSPASMIWYSQGYAERFPEKVTALHKNAPKAFTTSFLFHTLLDGGDLDTPYKESRQSLLSDGMLSGSK